MRILVVLLVMLTAASWAKDTPTHAYDTWISQNYPKATDLPIQHDDGSVTFDTGHSTITLCPPMNVQAQYQPRWNLRREQRANRLWYAATAIDTGLTVVGERAGAVELNPLLHLLGTSPYAAIGLGFAEAIWYPRYLKRKARNQEEYLKAMKEATVLRGAAVFMNAGQLMKR